MRNTIFFVGLLVVSLMAQSNKDKDHTKYFPLSVGSRWEYVNMKNGKVIQTTTTEVTKKKGEMYIVNSDIEMKKFEMTVNLQSWYITKNSKLSVVGGGGGLFGGEPKSYNNNNIELQFPLKVGLEWNYTEDSGRKVFRKVLNWYDTLKTEFGSYNNVFEIQEKIVDGGFTVYRCLLYAYGVGLVKEEIPQSNDGNGPRNDGNVLKSYSIK